MDDPCDDWSKNLAKLRPSEGARALGRKPCPALNCRAQALPCPRSEALRQPLNLYPMPLTPALLY